MKCIIEINCDNAAFGESDEDRAEEGSPHPASRI